MRFSPDAKPPRSKRPMGPKELLDFGTPERDIYTFDPEIDIPESVWTSLETTMKSYATGQRPHDKAMTLRMVANGSVVVPDRVRVWRNSFNHPTHQEMITELDQLGPNYEIYLESLVKYSWLFPERKAEMLDLKPSVLRQVKALVSRKERIDLKDKERVLQRLKQLTSHWRENNHLWQMCSAILFLTNFFPNGSTEARKVLGDAHITPEDLVGEIPKWENKNFRYEILEALAVCFPEARELIRQDAGLMTELAHVVRGGVELAGSDENYAEGVLAFDALTAEAVKFDHTGISIRRGPKKITTQKPIPPRPHI